MEKSLTLCYVCTLWIFLVLTPEIATASHPSFLNKRPCIALSNVRFYGDSSFLRPTEIMFEKGTVFQVIGETYAEHDDNAQEQTFKWYQLKTAKGLTGWIQGDAVAVLAAENRIDTILRFLHRKEMAFSSGFEKAICWIATVEGHDKVYDKQYLNPPYRETYIVISNDQLRSVYIHCGRISPTGRTVVRSLLLQDVTGENVPDFTLILGDMLADGSFENRELEIYAFQAGGLSRVFNERITLTYSNVERSPAIYKMIDIHEGMIRVAYADYAPCKAASDSVENNNERCLSYVTYTQIWDRRKGSFRTMYPESRVPLSGHSRQYLSLQELPLPVSRSVGYVTPEQVLLLHKHAEFHTVEKGIAKTYYFLQVQVRNGSTGYLPANAVDIVDMENAGVLKGFYSKAPLSKNEWMYKADFVTVNGVVLGM